MKKPRRDQKPYLTQALTAAQSSELARWLLVEEISYKEAALRLRARFGITVSCKQVFKFYHRVAKPRPVSPVAHATLDLRISHSKDGTRFLLVRRFPGVNVSVNGRKLRAGIFLHSKP